MARTTDQLVSQEVYANVTGLTIPLSQAFGHELPADLADAASDAYDVWTPLDDYESPAMDSGWSLVFHHGAGYRCIKNDAATDDDVTDYCRDADEAWQEACDMEGLEPYPREVFEAWAVSAWFGEKLESKGERVTQVGGLHVWSRTTTGQAIAMDWVVEQIAQDLNRND